MILPGIRSDLVKFMFWIYRVAVGWVVWSYTASVLSNSSSTLNVSMELVLSIILAVVSGWSTLVPCFADEILVMDHNISIDRNFAALLSGGNIKEMHDLILFGMKKEHFNINKPNPKLNEETPVLFAARLGNVNSLKELLNRGADFKVKNDLGETPLIVASKYNNAAVVEFLLSVEPPICDVNEQCDQNGDTALLKAAANNNVQIAEMLLVKSQGAGMKIRNKFGNAAENAASCGWVDMLKLLKRYGADFSVKDWHSNPSLLMCAACNNRINVIEYLLDHDPPLSDVNEKFIKTGSTPLMFACCTNKKYGYGADAIKLLLDKYGANINARDRYGETALMCAITKNNIEATKLLIQRDADAQIAACNGRMALTWAAIANRTKIIDVLLSQKPPICDVDERNIINGNTPLIATSHCMFMNKVPLDAMKLLVQKYNANVNAMDNQGRTALHWACKYNKVEMVRFLMSGPVRSRINVNISDRGGLTPAAIATMERNIGVLKFFEDE